MLLFLLFFLLFFENFRGAKVVWGGGGASPTPCSRKPKYDMNIRKVSDITIDNGLNRGLLSSDTQKCFKTRKESLETRSKAP